MKKKSKSKINWQRELMTINALSLFTGLDRGFITRRLDGVPPDDPIMRRYRLPTLYRFLSDEENLRVLRHRLEVAQRGG